MKIRTLLLLAGLAMLLPAGAVAHDDGYGRDGRDWGRYERRGDKQWRKQAKERAKAQRKADRAWSQYRRKSGGYGRYRDRDYGYRDYGYRDYRRDPRDRYWLPFLFR